VGQGVIRQLASGNSPRLRLSERDRGPVSAGGLRGSGGLRGPGPGRPAARREPQLKLGRPAARVGAAFAPNGLASGSARVKFGGRRREGVLGGSLLGVSGRALLGGSVFSRTSSTLGSGAVFGRSAPLGRSSPFRHRANLMRSAGGGLTGRGLTGRGLTGRGLTGRAPRLSRSGTPKSPGRNWLRGASSRSTFTRPKSLSSRGLGRKAFGRSRMSQPRVPRLGAKRRWGRRGGYL
jgi:hypothetical protein